jgi:hypothetical protein
MARPEPGPSVKDKHLYEKQRDEGNSKEKSARMANAAANISGKRVGRQGGSSSSYDDMTKEQLMKRAREVGISGRSTMSKSQLVSALRNH